MSPATTFTARPVSPSLVLDFSSIGSVREGEQQLQRVLDWVRANPSGRSIAVYVPVSLRVGQGRQLKTALQSLGCTVRTRCAVPLRQ